MAGAVRYEIEHVSRYSYDSSARQCVMLLCLEPLQDRGQRLLDFEIGTRPLAFLNRETDCFGNARHLLDLHREHRTLEITARSTVEVVPGRALPERLGDGAWEEIRSPGNSLRRLELHATERAGAALPGPRGVRRPARHRARQRPSRKSVAAVRHPAPLPALHPGKHHGGITGPAHPRDRKRCLSGLLPPHDRHRPFLGHPRPLRLRLPAPSGGGLAGSRLPTRPTPGSNAGCRGSAGSTSIPPTRVSPAKGMWYVSRRGGTTTMCHLLAASSTEGEKPGSMSRCGCKPPERAGQAGSRTRKRHPATPQEKHLMTIKAEGAEATAAGHT